MKTIGVLGGLGPQATMDFEARVHAVSRRMIAARRSGGYPPMVVSFFRHPPVLLTPDGDVALPLRPDPRLLESARKLGEWADFLVLPANFPHLMFDAIAASFGGPVLNLIEVTLREVARRRLQTIGVLGLGEPQVYLEPLLLSGRSGVALPPESRQALDQVVFTFMEDGQDRCDSRRVVRNAVDLLRSRGVQAIILGCTELPLILADEAEAGDIINPVQLLAEESVRMAIGANGHGDGVLDSPTDGAAPDLVAPWPHEVGMRDLAASLRGTLLRPDDQGYHHARRVWNGRVDRRPAAIVRCAGIADVVNAVRFACKHELPISIRSGGHNVAGTAVCDGGVMLDMSHMKGLRIDPEARTARVEPGLTWGEFDHETQALGLATTGALVSSTGVAGVTVGGGTGWLMRKHGLAVDNLLSADVVTADGQVLTTSESHHEDLFWALRGGGGNFGVVTSLEFCLHRVGPGVVGGVVMFPAACAPAVLDFFRTLMADAPDELSALVGFRAAPAAPFVPEDVRGKPIVFIAACFTGPVEDGIRKLAPLRTFERPVAERFGAMPYVAIQRMFDAAGAFGRLVEVRSDHLSRLSDDVVGLLATHASGMTSPLSVVLCSRLGGAIGRVGEHATAFSHRDAPYDYAVYNLWTDETQSDLHLRWSAEFWAALRPFTCGVYVNELGEEGESRVREAYSAANFERLRRVKARYDPENAFKLNQNIPPALSLTEFDGTDSSEGDAC